MFFFCYAHDFLHEPPPVHDMPLRMSSRGASSRRAGRT